MLESNLGIFVITYNRSKLLRRTLEFFVSSPLHNFPITVINNASTDDTAEVVIEMGEKLPNLQLVTNKVNVGANANFLKAFDYSIHEYTWVLCDDDIIDLSKFDDVLQVINEGQVNLIHVGAHEQKEWHMAGSYKAPRELISKGYAYFRFSSFMPCNIFKTKTFTEEYLIKGYSNIVNAYPHMPFAFGMFQKNEIVYISKYQMVFAQAGQSYDFKDWYPWWINTCILLNSPKDVRTAYLDQWKDNGIVTDDIGLKSLLHAQECADNPAYVKEFISQYFTLNDKFKISFFAHKANAEKTIKYLLSTRDRFYWFRVRMKQKFIS